MKDTAFGIIRTPEKLYVLALWRVVLKYLIYISLMSCYLWRLAAYLWPCGVWLERSWPQDHDLLGGPWKFWGWRPLEAKEVFSLNFGAKIKFIPVSFSWLHHVSVILVHSCPDKNRQEWTGMKKSVMQSGIYIKIGISYERYSFWHHQDSREAILALWRVVLKYTFKSVIFSVSTL